jgi:hypothetical protein
MGRRTWVETKVGLGRSRGEKFVHAEKESRGGLDRWPLPSKACSTD